MGGSPMGLLLGCELPLTLVSIPRIHNHPQPTIMFGARASA